MLSRYNPKTLAEWIELDFFRRSGSWRRARRLFTWACFFGAIAFVIASVVPRNRFVYEAGPLSSAHAIANHDCSICHVDAFRVARRFWPGNATMASVPDSACVQCHDSGPHHPTDFVISVGCSACHREHHGRERLAANVTDAQCDVCHANLQEISGGSSRFANVSGFPNGHPEFALWRQPEKPKDPGTIRFNHKVHLREEGVPVAQSVNGGDVRELSWVRLDCNNCHQPDERGQNFKPLKYETNCASCHPLSVEVAGLKPGVAEKAAREFSAKPAPHGSAAGVRSEMRERFIQFAQRNPEVTGAPALETPEVALPGRRRAVPATPAEREWANAQLQQTERVLFDGAGGCHYCHQERTDPAKRPDGLPDIPSSNLNNRWLTHARFRHQSHRMKSCIECHPAPGSESAGDVLIPSIDNCKECHNPKKGARYDCVECHDYHNSPQRVGPSGLTPRAGAEK
jgi:hypothetical protein